MVSLLLRKLGRVSAKAVQLRGSNSRQATMRIRLSLFNPRYREDLRDPKKKAED
ncbi:hypothetical protein D3C87_2177880 [compost metagenome]